MRIINCALCGKEVEAKIHNKKYCDDCAKIAHTATIQCRNCGKDFTVLKKHEKSRFYCSDECKKQYRAEHPWKKTKSKLFKCEICGKEFESTGSYVKFCTDCRDVAKKNRTYTNTCQVCGKQFVVPQTKKKQKFCSRDCYYKSREGIPNPSKKVYGPDNPRWRGVRIEIACAHCGEKFIRKNLKQKYCSMECASKEHGAKISGENNPHFKNLVEKECGFCGNKFKLPPYKASIRKYCSLQCANQALFLGAETSLEKAIRELLTENDIYFEQQHPFDLYTVDFLLPDYNVVVECDGEYWHSRPDQKNRDRRKDAYLRSLGFTVIRLKEQEIEKDLQGCLEKIKKAIDSTTEVNIKDEQAVNEGA